MCLDMQSAAGGLAPFQVGDVGVRFRVEEFGAERLRQDLR